MLYEMIGAFILLGVYIWVRFYLIAKNKVLYYKKLLEELGYKVKLFPFKFFGVGYFSKMQQDYSKYGDCAYSIKNIYPQYDVILYNFISIPTLHIITPELVKDFYSPQKNYYYPKQKAMIAPFKRLVNQGIIFAEGQNWKQRRKIISQAFNFDLIKALIPKIIKISNQEFQRFEDQNKLKDGKINVYITQIFTRITSNVVISSFFGSSVQNEKIDGIYLSEYLISIISELGVQSFSPWGALFGSWIFKVGFTSAHRSLNKRIKKMKTIANEIVKHKLEEIKKNPLKQKQNNLIENLVKHESMKNQNKKEFGYTTMDIVDQFGTFFAAGTDTTSNFITVVVYYLIQNPRVMKKVVEQINHFIKTDSDITYESLKQMKYLQHVIKQGTRIYNPGLFLFLREVKQDHLISGFPIPKGTYITHDFLPSHYNPKIFSSPFQFRPQRWQQEASNINPFILNGFGGNARSCIGKQFAFIQSKIIIIKLLKRYRDFKLSQQQIKMNMQFSYMPEKLFTEMTKIID